MNSIRLISRVLFFFVACAVAQNDKGVLGQLGEFAIGSSPNDLKVLISTDCVGSAFYLSDCSGVGRNGIRYAFFDGGLSRVSLKQSEVNGTVRLPGDVLFGETIDVAAAKLKKLGVSLDRDEVNGRIVYSSDFVLTSSHGIAYSIELLSDAYGRLVEVIERTDF